MTTIDASQCRWHEAGGGEVAAARCLAFLGEVGIEVDRLGEGQGEQLLGGLAILGGRILIDPATPVWPSDLLHEGGHIAVCDPERRASLGPLEADPTDEMMAIAWSYAAARQCDISLEQLFHTGGYRADSVKLRTSFATGHFIGAPMLGYYGMAALDLQSALAAGVPTFPGMIRWLR